MKKTNKEMDVIFLLDRSGSMSGCIEDTIGGFNSYINKQRKNKYKTKVTTVLFDDKYEVLYERNSIEKVKDLTNKEYYVRGSTALLDAIGKTINSLENKINKNKVLFIITTDGLENSSKEYRKEDIRKLIKKHNNWEFLYIGADIDSYTEGRNLGIKESNIANYKKDKIGISKLYSSLDVASKNYMENCLSSSWKKDLE